MKLRNKVAIVTGAGKGIGKGIAIELAKAGADVVVNYNASDSGANEIVKDITKLGANAVTYQADVSQTVAIKKMLDFTIEKFGKLDILVNNAGVSKPLDFFDVSDKDWEYTININLKGTFFCSQIAANEMKRNENGGRIINIGSIHSRMTVPQYSVYAASKGGVNGLTQAMALELAPYKIYVNAIAPGLVEVQRILDDPTYDGRTRAKQIPIGRIAEPGDIGKIAVFLASEDNNYITGQIIYADGGRSCELKIIRDNEN